MTSPSFDEQNFGVVPEYVLHIIPKRKERGLLLGDIWVDAKTFRIRQIIGVPLKHPSIWVENLHITVQFADVNNMWLPVSVDAIDDHPLSGHLHPLRSRFGATNNLCFKPTKPLITGISDLDGGPAPFNSSRRTSRIGAVPQFRR
jgi:hypothetical protein